MSRLFYILAPKPTYMNQLLMLPRDDARKVAKKVEQLQYSPEPLAKNKKRIKAQVTPTFRLRFGDYRIEYQIDHDNGLVILLSVKHRRNFYKEIGKTDAEYDRPITGQSPEEHLDIEEIDPEEEILTQPQEFLPDSQRPSCETTTLHQTVDDELLARLHAPEAYWDALRGCTTVEELLAASVPGEYINRLFDVLTNVPVERIAEKPNLELHDFDDFMRFYEGELSGLLLRLDNEQRKFVNWSINGGGPTLIKGGPGTGKTIIALHRIRSLIEALRKSGKSRPRLLFTAYNNTLITVAGQMLRELLGDDAELVEVITADALARRILEQAGNMPRETFDDGQGRAVVKRALDSLKIGDPVELAAANSLQNLGISYVFDEISNVIVGREHKSLESYLAENRTGRGVRLTQAQREAVWLVHEACEATAINTQKMTYPQRRRLAAETVRDSAYETKKYDGVVIDEAQDLQPTVLRMLVSLCESSDYLFLTADPNQSTYGTGFRWADVHEDLQFRGRTGVLRTNYRSTKQVMNAAGSYLRGAELENLDEMPIYPRNGRRPQLQVFATPAEQLELLTAFIRRASRELLIGQGGCAVLVPSEVAGRNIENSLNRQGLLAKFMAKESINLDAPGIKILTMKSAKGLEFPVVAIAGLATNYPGYLPVDAPDEYVREWLQNEQRTLYVAMTRAMDALLLLVPNGNVMLDVGTFDAEHWDITPNYAGT